MYQDLNLYDKETATLEILIMLLVAFAIGFLIGWLLRKRGGDYEQEIDQLKMKNAKLTSDLSSMSSHHESHHAHGADHHHEAGSIEPIADVKKVSPAPKKAKAKPKAKAPAKKKAAPKTKANEFASSIGISPAAKGKKDDLKKISGVGPVIEKKLNALGIKTFDQVASMNKTIIKKVTDKIQFFPGRIERDDWVGQAKKLAKK